MGRYGLIFKIFKTLQSAVSKITTNSGKYATTGTKNQAHHQRSRR